MLESIYIKNNENIGRIESPRVNICFYQYTKSSTVIACKSDQILMQNIYKQDYLNKPIYLS